MSSPDVTQFLRFKSRLMWRSSEIHAENVVGAAGLEPATLCLEGRCSIHLSYAPTRLA
jgi:hypothetical protein